MEALECFRIQRGHSPLLGPRIFYGAGLLVLSVLSLLLNINLASSVSRHNVIDSNFRLYVLSLVSASLLYLITNLAALIPVVLADVQLMDPLNIILSTPDTLAYEAIMFTTTTIAIDRFVFFYFSKVHVWFSRNTKRYLFLVLLPWLMSLFFTTHMTYLGCYKRVNPYTLMYTYGCSCSDCGFYDTLLKIFGLLFPLINFTLYLLLYVKISFFGYFESENENSRVLGRKELGLVVQFCLICCGQFLSSACFYLLPSLLNHSDLSYYLPMLFSTINTATNPLVILIFQPMVRQAFFSPFQSLYVDSNKVSRFATETRTRFS